jgi:hypothetical protein
VIGEKGQACPEQAWGASNGPALSFSTSSKQASIGRVEAMTGRESGTLLSVVPLSGYGVGEWYNASEDIPEFVSTIRPRREVAAAAVDVSLGRS